MRLCPTPSALPPVRPGAADNPFFPHAAVRALAVLPLAALVLAGAASPAVASPPRTGASAVADTLRVTLAAPEGGSVVEGAEGNFEVSVAGSTADGAVTVRYSVAGTATAGTDYRTLSGEVTVPKGENGARIVLSALDDDILDHGETVVLALTGASGATTVVVDPAPATATIADHGTVTVEITPMNDTLPEGAAWNSTVTLSSAVAERVSVGWRTTDGTAVAGSDYEGMKGSVVFEPGERSKTISVRTLEDDESEPVEMFYVALDPAVAAAAAAGGAGAWAGNGLRIDLQQRFGFIECTVEFPDGRIDRNVDENERVGTEVGAPVTAPTESIAYYKLRGGSGLFAIDDVTGQIKTTARLDHEKRSSYVVSVSVQDDCGASDTTDVAIKVNNVNEAPTVNAGKDQTVESNDPVTLSGTSTDLDGDDATLGTPSHGFAWVQTKGPTPKGGLKDANKRTATFTAPAVSDTTDLVFELKATDGGGLNDTDAVTVTVLPAPKCAISVEDGNFSLREDETDVGTVGVSAEHCGDLEYVLTGAGAGDVSVAAASGSDNAEITGNFDFEERQSYDLTLTVSEKGGSASNDGDVDIKVANVNEAPMADAGADQEDIPSESTVTLSGSSEDLDGDHATWGTPSHTFAWVQTKGPTPKGGLKDANKRTATFTAPAVSDTTDLVFELKATDGGGLNDTDAVTVTVLPAPKCAISVEDGNFSLREDETDVGTVGVSAEHCGDLEYVLTGAGAGDVSVAAASGSDNAEITGNFDFEERQSYDLTLTVSEKGGSASNDGDVDIKVANVNEAPMADAGADQEDIPSESTVTLSGSSEDLDGDHATWGTPSHTFAWVQTKGPSPPGGLNDANKRTATFTAPAVSDTTDLVFELKVTDGGSLSHTDAVTITVKPRPNKPPVFDPPSYSFTTDEAVSVNTELGRVHAEDPEGGRVRYFLSSSSYFKIGTGTGAITVKAQPPAGTYRLTATARDSVDAEGTAKVTIKVNRVVTPPDCTVGVENHSFGVYSDETLVGTVQGWTQGSDCGSLRYELSGADAAPFSIGQSSGRVTVTGSLSVRTYVMTVKVRDGNGHASASATLTVGVTDRPPTALAPVFGRTSYSWAVHDTASTGHVVGTVTATDGNRDRITYALSDTSRFKVGRASGVVTVAVAPPADTYKLKAFATDPGGLSDTAAVTITVTTPPPTNRAPVIESVIPARAVVAGDSVAVRVSPHFSDPDKDALTYTASSSARTVATVRASNDTVWVRGVSKGSADVTVAAADPRGLSVSQAFSVTVSQGNGAPEIVRPIPAMAFAAGDSMVVDVSSHFRDPDGDALNYEARSSSEAAATVRVSGSKVTVRGVSPGESRVTVTARDTHGASVSQDFKVTVEEANEAPVVLKPIPAMTLAPTEYSVVDLSEHFSDPDGDDLEYAAASSDEAVATVRVQEDRLTVTGVLRGASPVTVTAKDEHGASVSLEFVATVPNRAPERLGTIPDRTIERGDTASVAVPGYFGDLEGDTLTYTAASSDGDVLAVGMIGDRARFEGLRKGSANVTVTADDGHGGRTDQGFVVTVEGANGPPEAVGAIPALTVARGEMAVVDASPHFRDPDGDTLRYEASSSNEAAATVKVSGSEVSVTGVSRGESLVTVTARDPEGASVSQAFLVTVPNGPPVAVGSLDPLTLDHGTSALVEVSSAFSDPDGDSLAYRASSSDGNVVHVAVRGSRVAVNGLKRGVATITVTADDGHGGTVEQAFEVTVRNAAPRFGLPAYERAVAEHAGAGTAVGEPVTAFDTGGDALTYSFAGQGGGPFGIVASSGQITVAAGAAPDYERGDTLHAVRVVASDGTLADTVGVTIRVTDVPAPGRPDAPVVTGGDGEVEVSWSAPANEGPEITNYDLRHRTKSGGDWTEPAAVGAVLASTITGLDAGTTYEAQVRAESSEGASEWSEPGEGTTDPDNRSPSFDAEAYEREVPENSAPGTEVGAPVTATDDDQDDLTYSLVTGGDEAPFVIDGATGQVKVAEGAALDYESGKTAYEVSVRASDGTLAATAAVTIRVTDVPAPGKPDAPTLTGGTEEVEVSWTVPVNEGPEITDYDLRYRAKPGGEWKDAPVVGAMLTHTITGLEAGTTYEAQVRAISSEGAGEWSEPGEGTTDPDNRAPSFDAEAYEREVPENSAPGTVVGEPVTATDDDQDELTYSFAAGGEAPFEIDGTTGRITVAEGAALNYESPDTLYVVSVEARDRELADTASVTIRVTNADDPGKVALSPDVARVGVELTATLMDEDGVLSAGRRRTWQRSAGGNSWNDIGTGRMYNPVTSDAGRWLRAVFTYSDGHGPGKRAVSAAVKVQPGNAAPDFGADAFEREVPENSAAGTNVGEPVTATDDNDDDLKYVLLPGGAKAPFDIGESTGRITVAEGAALNYESPDTLFTVLVEASDGELADTASVTIRVTDADDPGKVALSPEVVRVGVELTATLMDEDGVRSAGRQRRWQRSRNGNSWNEVGRGRMYNPVTSDEGKWLRLVITYSDGHGSGKRAVSAAVKVLPANAAPSFGAAYEREVPENSPGGTNVGAPVAATDPDSPSLSYSFAEGGDEALFGIVEATGQITVADGAALDYESGDTLLAVRVEASDGELADTASVKIRVTNADDPGRIALSADVARVGVRLTATLTDQDRSIERSKMRTWQRSPDGTAWTMVVRGAERRFYTPTEADKGKYLRAVFTYTDGHGPGKRAESPAVMVVGATTPVVSFGAESYTAAPGGSADVAVLLSPAASSALAIEVVARDAKHTVTFQTGASRGTLAVSTGGLSASDTVAVRFGDLPEGVAVGVPATTRIVVAAAAGDRVSRSVVEDGSPTELEVEYAQAEYSAVAGGPGTEIVLRLSPAADRRVAVPVTATQAVSMEAALPDSVVFEPGDSLAAFTLDVPAGTGANLLALGFGALPEAVSAGAVASATVDITDHDPGPLRDEAFEVGLAVLGRAVAEGARQAVGARIDAVMRPAGGGSGTGLPGSAAEWAGRAAGTLASLTGAPLNASSAADMTRRSGSVDLPTGREAARRLLPSLSFATALGPQSAQGRPRIGLWAEGSAQSFRGEPGIDYDGGLRALTVGADARIGSSALLGVSLMRSDGDLDYGHRSAEGSLGHAMNSVHPYLFVQPSPRIGLWAMAGYGSGDVRDDDRHGDTGASLRMLSGGVKLPLARKGAFGLALNGDAFTVGMSAEDGQREGSASRARALLEASWTAGGLKLATQAGARYDGGDADTGGGAETGASIGYAAHGLDLDLRGRLALGSGRHREWGAALRLAFDPGTRGEGFRLAVSPRHGHDRNGIHGLMDGGTFHAVTPDTGPNWRLDAEAGYGLKNSGMAGALDSYTRLSADGRNRSWSFGSRYSVSQTLRLGIEGSRDRMPGQTSNLGLKIGVDFQF